MTVLRLLPTLLFSPLIYKKANYKIPISKRAALSKGPLLPRSAHWQKGKYKKEIL